MNISNDTIRAIQVICGCLILLAQPLLEALDKAIDPTLVFGALALLFGVPAMAGLETRRRQNGSSGHDQ